MTGRSKSRPVAPPPVPRTQFERDQLLLAQHDFGYFFAYINGWRLPPFQQEIAERLRVLEQTPDDRLMLVVAPSSGKTELMLCFALWCLGRYTHGLSDIQSIGYASYSERLPKNTSAAIKRHISSNSKVRAVFPNLELDVESVMEWRIAYTDGMRRLGVKPPRKDPSFFACSIGGGATGYHFDLLICDDPVKSLKDARSLTYREDLFSWWRSVWSKRIVAGSRFIVCHTRWTDDDLIAYIQRHDKKTRWQLLHYPALYTDEATGALCSYWPAMYPVETLLDIREEGGISEFNALFQGNPTPAEGNLFSRESLRHWSWDDPPSPETVICSWDTAIKEGQDNDFSVGLRIGLCLDGTYAVLGGRRGRFRFPRLISEIDQLAGSDAVVIEDASSGSSAIQTLKDETAVSVIGVTPVGSKYDRAMSVVPLMEAGKVLLPPLTTPDGEPDALAEQLVAELLAFPNSDRDDCVDSLVHGMRHLKKLRSKALVGCSANEVLRRSAYSQLYAA